MRVASQRMALAPVLYTLSVPNHHPALRLCHLLHHGIVSAKERTDALPIGALVWGTAVYQQDELLNKQRGYSWSYLFLSSLSPFPTLSFHSLPHTTLGEYQMDLSRRLSYKQTQLFTMKRENKKKSQCTPLIRIWSGGETDKQKECHECHRSHKLIHHSQQRKRLEKFRRITMFRLPINLYIEISILKFHFSRLYMKFRLQDDQ